MLGGDFQIKAELLLRADTGNSPLDRINEGDALLDTGRSAIHAAIASAIDANKIKKAWVPFYSCQTMIQKWVTECPAHVGKHFFTIVVRAE